MYPEGIPTGAYTHLNFAFAFVDPTTFQVAPMASTDVDLYTRFTGLKDSTPGLQTWISIGGWSMNDPDQPTHATFSDLAGSTDAQSKFFASLLSFLSTYGFDGVDMDWEYPVAPERSGNTADFANYVSFLNNLKNAFQSSGHNYGLSITIPSSYWYMQNFDIVAISKVIDWFNVMTYDLHGTWDSTDKYIGSYVYAHTNLTEIDQTMGLLWRNNIDPNKVTLGLGFYGRSFTLADPSCTAPGCPFSSGGNPGACTASAGTLSFAEIERIVAAGAQVTQDTAAAVKQVVWDTNQWVSYDDADTFKLKIDYANSHCLGGTMVWASSTDDASGTAANALSGVTGRSLLSRSNLRKTPDAISSCQWGECGKNCPTGTSPAANGNNGGDGSAGFATGCSGSDTRSYCCPTNDLPTCTWRGSAPFCKGKCHDGEVEITSASTGSGKPCWTGHKVLCCTSNTADEAVGKCHWEGSAPTCSASFSQAACSNGRQALTYSTYGAGGEQGCSTGSKSLCCDQPPPYQNCKWEAHGGSWFFVPLKCGGGCPSGKQVVAVDPTGCLSGTQSFCCDQQVTTNDPVVTDFTTQLQAFAKDPTCPPSGRKYSKRDSIASVVEARTSRLTKRDAKVEAHLVPRLSTLFRNPSPNYESELLLAAYNTTFGEPFDLLPVEFQGYYDSWPNTDPNSLTEKLFCMGKTGDAFLTGYNMGVGASCINPCTGQAQKRRRRDLDSLWYTDGHVGEATTDLSKRVLENQYDTTIFGNGVDTDPSWGYIVDQIVAGNFPILYERLFLTNSGENILEVAWTLPLYGGTIDPDNQGDPRGGDPDRYVVFHFHTEHLWTTPSGQVYPGIYAIVAFHGQDRITQDGNRNNGRVDGNDQIRNLRAQVLECNTGDESNEETFFWYPGEQGENDVVGDMATLMARFGSFLRSQQIVTPSTFTAANQGQLTLVPYEGTACPAERQNFDWGRFTMGQPFLPGGGSGNPGPGGSSDEPAGTDGGDGVR